MSQGDEDFAALFAQSEQKLAGQPKLSAGQVVHGTVVDIRRDTVFVDVGTRSEATVSRQEFVDGDGRLTISVGDRIRATVAKGGDRPQLVVSLGRRGMQSMDFELARDGKTPVSGKVTKVVKAGLELDIGGQRCFCPASQVDDAYTPDLSIYEDQELQVLVIEVRDNGRSIVVSRRALLQDERKQRGEQALAKLEQGAIVEGTVQSIQSYGAFVDIGGIEGLVHVSELAHARVDRVEDVVNVGETVKVQVLDIQPAVGDGKPKIRLSMKSMTQAPTVPKGNDKVLDAKVTKVEPFGVFVATESHAGLVPTRELGLPPGADPRKTFPVGKEVKVVVLGQDDNARLRFSIRQVADAEARSNYREFAERQTKADRRSKSDMGSFGALLKSKLDR